MMTARLLLLCSSTEHIIKHNNNNNNAGELEEGCRWRGRLQLIRMSSGRFAAFGDDSKKRTKVCNA